MRAIAGLLGAAFVGLSAFSLGWGMRQPRVISAIHQDYSLYDVYWQVEGEPPIALCRGPKMDHRMQFITCLMAKGTPAPWVVPSESEAPVPRRVGRTGDPGRLVFVDLGRGDQARATSLVRPLRAASCPESYVYCRTHMTVATFDGVEPGLDGKVYYKYSHDQDGYPAGKHVILRQCE